MSKALWQSKTAWFGLFTAASPLISSIFGFDLSGYMREEPEMVGLVWGALAIGVRFVTKDKIRLF